MLAYPDLNIFPVFLGEFIHSSVRDGRTLQDVETPGLIAGAHAMVQLWTAKYSESLLFLWNRRPLLVGAIRKDSGLLPANSRVSVRHWQADD